MQQFKLKPLTKRSSTNVASNNLTQNPNSKKSELAQNNDLINLQEIVTSEQTVGQSVDLLSRNPPNLLRNQSLRPRSGLSRNLAKNSKTKQQKTDEEIIQQRIKQKLLANTIGERPLTSGMNETSGLRYEKHQKLMKRRTATNSNNTLSGFGNKANRTSFEHETLNAGNSAEEVPEIECVSNEQVLSIMQQIIDHSGEFNKLKDSNEEQFMRIRNKLISNVSIIVLKWYKIVQDQLFHEVKKLGDRKQTQDRNEGELTKNSQKIPESIEELVEMEVRKQFSVKNGLFAIEQRCSNQQSKLSMLIDGRLERLENLLAQCTAR